MFFFIRASGPPPPSTSGGWMVPHEQQQRQTEHAKRNIMPTRAGTLQDHAIIAEVHPATSRAAHLAGVGFEHP